MAMSLRPRPRGRGTGAQPRQPIRPTYENIKPKSEWKHEDDATLLLVYLPGFVKEQIRITHYETARSIKVQGQRPLASGRWSVFTEIFSIPETCDISKINSQFERGVLTIIMPKIVHRPKEEATAHHTQEPASQPPPPKIATTAVIKEEQYHEDKNVEAQALTPHKATTTNDKKEKSEVIEQNHKDHVVVVENKSSSKVAVKEKESSEKSKESAAAANEATKGGEEKSKEDSRNSTFANEVVKGVSGGVLAYPQGRLTDHEERQLLLNIGSAILVIVGLGASIIYTVG